MALEKRDEYRVAAQLVEQLGLAFNINFPKCERYFIAINLAEIGLSKIDFKTAFSRDAGRARATARIILAENKSLGKPDLTELTELWE